MELLQIMDRPFNFGKSSAFTFQNDETLFQNGKTRPAFYLQELGWIFLGGDKANASLTEVSLIVLAFVKLCRFFIYPYWRSDGSAISWPLLVWYVVSCCRILNNRKYMYSSHGVGEQSGEQSGTMVHLGPSLLGCILWQIALFFTFLTAMMMNDLLTIHK